MQGLNCSSDTVTQEVVVACVQVIKHFKLLFCVSVRATESGCCYLASSCYHICRLTDMAYAETECIVHLHCVTYRSIDEKSALDLIIQ